MFIHKLRNILNSSFLKKYFLIFFSTNIVKISLNLTASVILINLVSKSDYGFVVLIPSIVNSFGFLKLPGLDVTISKHAALKNNDIVFFSLRKAFFYSLFLSPILLLISLYYYLFQDNYTISKILLFLSVIKPAHLFFQKWQPMLSGLNKFGKVSIFNALVSLDGFFALAIFYFTEEIWLYIISLFAFRTLSCFSFFIYGLNFIKVEKKSDGELIESEIKNGMTLTKVTFFSQLVKYLDQIIIASFGGLVLLAGYSVAKRLLDVINLVIQNMISLISIRFLKSDNYKGKVLSYFPFILLFSIVAYISLYYLSPYLILLVFPEYSESVNLFRWTSLSLLFMPYNWFLGKYLTYMNYIRENTFLVLSWSLLRSILYFLLYQEYGIYGIFYTEIITNIYAAIIRTLVLFDYFSFLNKKRFGGTEV